MNYYLGIDIGTTATKAVAFSENADVLATHECNYTIQHTQPDYSEQNPDELFDAVIEGIKEVILQLTPHLPLFISFSAAMHSLIAVNEKGDLLTQCIIWADNRSAVIADDLKSSQEGRLFYQITGVPVHPMSPLCKLLWFKENEPVIFDNAFKFIGIKEYIFFRLFGEFVIDTSIASATGLLNNKTLDWDERILQYIGVGKIRLSKIVSVKHISYYNNLYTDLCFSKAIPFVIGGGDGALSNIGTGATGKNILAINIGTSCAARMLLDAPETDEAMRTFCYHVLGNNYIIGGAGNNGAVVLQWLKENILETDLTFEALFEQAAGIAPGSDGLILLPYMLGERAPIWNAAAKAVYFGLHARHTQAHLIRAALEGVIYGVYSIGKIVSEKRNITEIHASGGFTKSSIWVQMLCDIFNTKVIISGALESVALGAVMLGAKALSINVVFNMNAIATYYPNQNNHKLYTTHFEKYERLYKLLKDEM